MAVSKCSTSSDSDALNMKPLLVVTSTVHTNRVHANCLLAQTGPLAIVRLMAGRGMAPPEPRVPSHCGRVGGPGGAAALPPRPQHSPRATQTSGMRVVGAGLGALAGRSTLRSHLPTAMPAHARARACVCVNACMPVMPYQFPVQTYLIRTYCCEWEVRLAAACRSKPRRASQSQGQPMGRARLGS